MRNRRGVKSGGKVIDARRTIIVIMLDPQCARHRGLMAGALPDYIMPDYRMTVLGPRAFEELATC